MAENEPIEPAESPDSADSEEQPKERRPGPKLLRFRWDLMPIFRSKRVAEQMSGETIAWEREREGEDATWRRRSLYSVGVIAAVCLLGAAVWLYVVEGRASPEDSAVAESGGDGAVVRAFEDEVEAVKGLVSTFMGATALDDKLACVVASEGIEARMGDYYERHPTRAKSVFDFPMIALKVAVSGNYYVVQALATDGEKLNFVVVVEDAGLKIAWEAHVGYSEMDWDRYIEERPEKALEMRVYVEPANHYRAPYEDRGEFLSVEISRPNSLQRLFAYVSRSETEGVGRMDKVLLSGQPEPVLVSLRIPDGQAPEDAPLVLVDSFLQRGWFLAPPSDEQAETGE
jgi:hypothetical protein